MQPNALAFIALGNEFCSTLEQLAAGSSPLADSRSEFVASMLNYIPRLYISATDLRSLPSAGDDDGEFDSEAIDCVPDDWSIEQRLDEDYYDAVRRAIEAVLGEEDVYLEVFEEDMKYSDTPVSASVAEGLADMFQSLYNFIETVRDAPSWRVTRALRSAKEEFEHYWSRTACNLMRALNNIRYFTTTDAD